MPQIHFNGKTYNDLAEMPATEREIYDQLMSVMVDENGNGIPDLLEGDVVGNFIKVVRKSGGSGEGIEALEQMSPEMRARISKGVAKLNELGLLSQIPDASEMDLETFENQKQVPSWEDAQIRPSKPVISQGSVIQEESATRLLVPILVLVLVLACGAAIAAYLFFGQGL